MSGANLKYICFRTGAAAAWVDTVETFGSGILTIGEVLEPAIKLAEEGYVFKTLYHFSHLSQNSSVFQ
jgi:gamma-glutamyltranspeptidase